MLLNKIKKTFLINAIFALFMPCFANASNVQSLDELKKLKYSKNFSSVNQEGALNADDVRLREVRNTALALGAQHGYVNFMKEIKRVIKQDLAHLYDMIFDFNTIMKLSDNKIEEMYLLPPVLTKISGETNLYDSAKKMTFSEESYYIERGGMLVTAAPNWRQYLIFDYPTKVNKPPSSLLPRNLAEEAKWKEWIQEGWSAGVKQADREMTYRARALKRDYKGMVNYLQAVETGLINKPTIVSSVQNVVGGGKQMKVNEHTIQISLPAGLNNNADLWETLVLDSRKSLRYPDEMTDKSEKYLKSIKGGSNE